MDNELFQNATEVKKVDVDGYVAVDDAVENQLRNAIAENAKGPKKVTGDAGSVEQHSLKDQIEAERFLQSKKATQKPGLGIRLHKIAADGTV